LHEDCTFIFLRTSTRALLKEFIKLYQNALVCFRFQLKMCLTTVIWDISDVVMIMLWIIYGSFGKFCYFVAYVYRGELRSFIALLLASAKFDCCGEFEKVVWEGSVVRTVSLLFNWSRFVVISSIISQMHFRSKLSHLLNQRTAANRHCCPMQSLSNFPSLFVCWTSIVFQKVQFKVVRDRRWNKNELVQSIFVLFYLESFELQT
jgi:hypothetical protein